MKRLFFAIAIALIGLTAFTSDPPGTKVPIGLVVGAGKTKTVIDSTELKRIKEIDNKVSLDSLQSATDQFYTKTQSNARFINEDGDTITGTILVPTPTVGTITTQVVNAAFVEESVSNPAFMAGISAAGSAVKLLPLVLFAPGASTYTMVDGRALYILADLKYPRTLTGIRTALATAGDYTADNFNGIALYSIASDGTATRVAISADTPNCWKTTAGSELVIPFTAPYNAPAGLYAIHAIYNSSAQTTAPVLMTGSTLTNGSPNNAFGLLNSIKFSGYAAETTPPASITYSSITGLINIPVLLGY